MDVQIQPTVRQPDRLRWDVDAHWVEGVRDGTGWTMQRSWARGAVALAAEPEVGVRLGADEAVAYLDAPLALAPGERAESWLEWPLELVVGVGGDVVEAAPRARHTVLGTVEEGRVIPAAVARRLDGPSAAPASRAALRMTFHNRAAAPVLLRRCPVVEGSLALHRAGSKLAVGTMDIAIYEAQRAEAHVSELAPPEGFAVVRQAVVGSTRSRFDWLLDATRRSAEFQL